MNLTERDIGVVDFINTYKVATTKMLINMLYSNYNVGTRRLKLMVGEGYLKRSRIATGEWVYHTEDSNILLHNLMITKFVVSLKDNGVVIKDVYYGKKIGDVEVDAQMIVRQDDKDYMLLVESELVGSFNRSKYDTLYSENKVIKGYSPIVVVIDNKPIDTDDVAYPIIRIDRGMSNIFDLLDILTLKRDA